MWSVLSKTSVRLLHPIVFIWLILLLALFLAIYKREAKQAFFCGGLSLFITILGSTKLTAWLLAGMEKPYAIENLESLPECDAVVVLGGGYSFSSKGFNGIEFNGAVDRIIIGCELMRQGKGKAMVISGGVYSTADGVQSTGILLEQWLESWNVIIDKPILDLGVNSNTRDEAVSTAAMAREKGWKKIILVTSAWHMRRSEAVFSKTGLKTIPVGADFEGTSDLERKWNYYDLIPSIGGFDKLSIFIHEHVGWWYYKFRGWV